MILYSTSLAESSCGQLGRGSLRSRPQENRFKGRHVDFFNWGGAESLCAYVSRARGGEVRRIREARGRGARDRRAGAGRAARCHSREAPPRCAHATTRAARTLPGTKICMNLGCRSLLQTIGDVWYNNLHEFGLQVSFTNDWRCVVQQFA